MKKFPPHLPSPACSINSHETMTKLKLFLASIISGLAAGLVGAIVMINAWYPATLNNTTVVVPNRNTNPTLDSSVVREWRPRLISVFDSSKKATTGNYYLASSRLGTAVVVNAGGWAIMDFVPKLTKNNIIGLDYQGQELVVEELVAAEKDGLWYIKFKGSDFRATASFAARGAVQANRILWGLGSDWQPYTVGQKITATSAVVSATEVTVKYPLRELGAENRVLITDRGEFVGFSNKDRIIIPVWMAPELLPKIMSGQKPPFVSFGWQGSFVTAVRAGVTSPAVDGFLLTDPGLNNEQLKKGDIILMIENQKVTPENIFELLLVAPPEFSVSIIRDTETLSLTIKK